MWINRLGLSLLILGVLFLSVACFTDQEDRSISGPDSQSKQSEPSNLTDKNVERRNEIESKMMRGEYLHDGALELSYIGDIDSVPALLVVLKENPPQPNGVMVCTSAHALETLRKLTSANAGITHDAWLAWWTKYKKKHPVSGRLEK